MCRVLTYLGEPILIEALLSKPDNSLIKQSYAPKFMSHIQNLAGFGMSVWNKDLLSSSEPFIFKTLELPFFSHNLIRISRQIQSGSFMAHVRGIRYEQTERVSTANTHPFLYNGFKAALAHNGDLAGFDQMKYDLIKHIKPDIAKRIQGTTDSEWMYAVFTSQLENPEEFCGVDELLDAVTKTFKILKLVKKKNNLTLSSPVNLFISSADCVLATRFVFNFGSFPTEFTSSHMAYHSLWYTYGTRYGYFDGEHKMIGEDGNKCSVIISSEPLTTDTTTWIEVPEYTAITAERVSDKIQVKLHDLFI